MTHREVSRSYSQETIKSSGAHCSECLAPQCRVGESRVDCPVYRTSGILDSES